MVTKLSKGFSLTKVTLGFCTRWASEIQVVSKAWAKSTFEGTMSMAPLVSDEMARISFTRRNNMSQLFMITLITSCFSSGVDIIDSTSEKPTMAFSGVRISWVILAIKVLFFSPDALARSVSSFRRSCFSIRSVTFRTIP